MTRAVPAARFGALSLLFLALAVAAPAQEPNAEDPAAPPQGQTHVVKKGSLSLTIDAEGSFEPVGAFEVWLRPKAYPGDLLVVSAAPDGSAVAKGDVLLQLDAEEVRHHVETAENELATARANLKKAEADLELGAQADALALKEKEHALAVAEASLKWWEEVDGKHLLEGADLEVLNLRDATSDQEEELDQLRKMYKTEDLTTATADIVVKRAVRGLDRTKVRLRMQEESAKKVKAHEHAVERQKLVFGIEGAKQELAQLRAAQEQGRALRQTALVTARLAAARGEEHVADLKADLAGMTVRAPAAGTALHGRLEKGVWQGGEPEALRPGDKVAANQVLLVVYAPGRLGLALELPESQLFWMRPEMKVAVTATSLPGLAYTGACLAPARTATAGDRGSPQAFRLPISLPQVDERLVPGMRAQAHIEVAELADVLLVPSAAISHGKVRVKTPDGKEERHAVVVGRSDGEMTEIKDGLLEGDEVLLQEKKDK
ncbi:MAG: hypothetical protein HYZ53_24350 [Planctomycetes bacterium]|nr:hypothetical protein [Planctomycetota bacterium]